MHAWSDRGPAVPGKLVVCPTPIGNLEDITLRVRRALHEADVIACEDTRRTGLLLERLEIEAQRRFVSNHEGNEAERARSSPGGSSAERRVALVSDPGMPVISDPGYRLIRACIDRDLDLEVPCRAPTSIPTALVASGLPADALAGASRASCRSRRPGELERVLQATETLVAFGVAAATCRSRCAPWRPWRRIDPRPSAGS